MGLGSFFKKIGRLFVHARPIIGLLLPQVDKAIDLVEGITMHLKESGGGHVLTGEHKEDLAVWQLLNTIDGLTGDNLSDEQEALIRAHIKTGVALKNGFK